MFKSAVHFLLRSNVGNGSAALPQRTFRTATRTYKYNNSAFMYIEYGII